MTDCKPTPELPLRDLLITRPNSPLPTTLDPSGRHARGYPADPKPIPKAGQGNPAATNPAPGEVGRSA